MDAVCFRGDPARQEKVDPDDFDSKDCGWLLRGKEKIVESDNEKKLKLIRM